MSKNYVERANLGSSLLWQRALALWPDMPQDRIADETEVPTCFWLYDAETHGSRPIAAK